MRGKSDGALLERVAGRRDRTPARRVGQPRVLGRAGESEPAPQLRGRARDHRRREQRDDAQRLEAVAEHRRGRGRVARLVRRPRLALLDVRVGVADQLPHRAERVVEREVGERGLHRVERGRRLRGERTVGARVRDDAAAVGHRHVQHAAREVAEVVGEVGVVAGDHPLVAEVAVLAEAQVGDEVVAERRRCRTRRRGRPARSG